MLPFSNSGWLRTFVPLLLAESELEPGSDWLDTFDPESFDPELVDPVPSVTSTYSKKRVNVTNHIHERYKKILKILRTSFAASLPDEASPPGISPSATTF